MESFLLVMGDTTRQTRGMVNHFQKIVDEGVGFKMFDGRWS